MTNVYAYVVKYSEGQDDLLRTASVPFTLADLKNAKGIQRYPYKDHEGRDWEATIDTDKVVDLVMLENPPMPPPPTM